MPTLDAHGLSLDDAEDLLLDAMRTSDLETLDALIADELAFTLPDGTTIGKLDDLESHRTGATRFERLTALSRHSTEHDGAGETQTAVDAVILWNGDRIEATLTYSRSWRIVDGRWQVVSGAAVPTA
ncbi:nuclear transport factor 2 family protein [Microcella sp.]|uniref:nuclear transport factor 2 family protein n=1 Tax=Microcella sp. TaxID=1913979 RepID=UPI003F6F5230